MTKDMTVPEQGDIPVFPFSRPVSVVEVPPDGLVVDIEANPEECAALAEVFDILGVSSLSARFQVLPWRKRGVQVKGTIDGNVTQACVVTLDPVEQTVHEDIDLDFLPVEQLARIAEEVEVHAEGRDPPEAIVEGTIDLGALAAEYLALGLDPYPRKEGAVFEGFGDAEEVAGETRSPFAGLDKLRKPGG